MELINFDTSRVIHLISVTRPGGQLYAPDLVRATAERYQFLKGPTVDDLIKREVKFSVGKFNDFQIQEFAVYSDGLIVTAAADTDILEAFIEDMLTWGENEFGFTPIISVGKPERHFESLLIIKSEVDLAKAMTISEEILTALNALSSSGRYIEAEFKPSGLAIDCDPQQVKAVRKPMSFGFERRLGISFEENVFYSKAPLRTKDHLDLLRLTEDVARRR